jgi:glycosyltransferase involved in cell wall biosynthesis
MEVSAALMNRCSGVGNYIAHLIGELRKLEAQTDLDLLYFSNRADFAGTGAKLSGLQAGTVYEHDRLPIRTAWMQLGLPRSLVRTRPDLCHFPNYLAPVIRPVETPFLATMYDMSVYRYPEYHPLKTTLIHRAIMPTVAQRANLLITVSESARQDILHYLKVPPEKVRVVYGGVDNTFFAPPASDEEVAIRQRYKLPFPYILMVGTLEPRKNHARMVQAFSQLIRQERLPHHLVFVGAHGWKEGPLAAEIHKSGVQDRIHFLGYVSDQALPALYRHAAAFCFPSLHEGFGLPVLEALACGTPTFISNDPALLEISGPEVAMVVEPRSVESIAAVLYQLLTDAPLAETLRVRGPLHARQFSWEQCAAQTLALYEEVAANKPAFAFSLPVAKSLVTNAADSGTPQPTYRIEWSEPEASPIIVQTEIMPPVPGLAFDFDREETEPTPLEQAIFETVLYSDVFTFALNLLEIYHYLIGQRASLEEVRQCLSESVYLKRRLAQQEDYFYLRGRTKAFEQRKASDLQIERHWRTVRRWGKLLRAVPFLRGALVTGSLAAGSARPHDDIDFLLITAPGHLWTCRAFVIGLVYLSRLSGTELCPNYLLVATDRALTLTEHNLYTAREFAQMRLLFGQESYRRLLELNSTWVNAELPNTQSYLYSQPPVLKSEKLGRFGGVIKHFGEKLLSGRFGKKLEQWEQRRKIARLGSQEGAETRFTAEVCKGHFGNYGQETLKVFAEKCRLYAPVAKDSQIVQEVFKKC